MAEEATLPTSECWHHGHGGIAKEGTGTEAWHYGGSNQNRAPYGTAAWAPPVGEGVEGTELTLTTSCSFGPC